MSAGAVFRGRDGLLVWEGDEGRFSFEPPAQKGGRVDPADLVDMEGAVDLAGLDACLAVAVADINAWLGVS